MSSVGISFGGLASGLDTKAIIAALMAVERRPITALEQRKKNIEKQRTLYGDLTTKLEKLRGKADAIRKSSSFLEFKAAVDVETFLAATASTGATAGSYDIRVAALAAAETSTSLGKADKDTTTYGGGLLKFTIDGNVKYVTIDSGNNTLQGIANAINASSTTSDDFVASVLDTGSGPNRYKLVVTGRHTGASQAFTVEAEDADPALAALAAEVNANQTQAATDASLTINNVAITRSSNTITDAIAGVTLNLKSADASKTTKLVVSTDTSKTAEKIKGFVDAYNDVVDFVMAQSKVDEKGTAQSLLFGDVTLRSIRSQLRSIVGSAVDTGSNAVNLLVQVGVTSDKDGKLTFNQSKFEEVVGTPANEPYLKKLFADATLGIAERTYDTIEAWLDTSDGPLQARKNGFATRIKQADDQIQRHERRLEAYEKQLTHKFANLEQMLSRLQSQGSALGAITGTRR
jgi:flagellar hook-associated protein 2